MSESRTYNALKNSIITALCQAVYLISSFVGRTVLTKILGTEYLGINGLFTNVLTILSFAELGIGSTLVFRMYKPLADGDTEKLTAYIRLYKKIYSAIIAVVSICGIAVIPFLKYIVKAPNVKENLILLYALYLADTVFTYAYVYKKSILIADQKSYIVSVFTQIFNIIMNVVQCIVLIVTQNFIMYFAVRLICNLLNNISCSRYAQKRYPFITQNKSVSIEQEEIDGLKKDVKGLLLTKAASTAFSGTDNIFISAFIGIDFVGILSNYTMILNTVNALMNNIFGSITASVGNLNVTGSLKQTENVMYRLWFINTMFYGYVSIGMIILIRQFITEIWFDKDHYLPYSVIITAVIELFLRSVHYPLYTVRTSLGLFSEYKALFVVAAVLNIILDFMFVKTAGITGLFIATILCRGITYITDIYAVYKLGFKRSPKKYYKNSAVWMIYLTLLCTVLYFICGLISIGGIAGFISKLAIITLIYIILTALFFRKNDDFRFFVEMLSSIKRKVKGTK